MLSAEIKEAFVRSAHDGIESEEVEVSATTEGFEVFLAGETTTVDGEDELATLADRHAATVEDWYFWSRVAPPVEHRKAFLRWIEAEAEEATTGTSRRESREQLESWAARTWGQLRIQVRRGEGGHRSYEIRHVADVDRPPEELTSYEEPADARDVARTDDRGRYRPLSTAPSLDRGWIFPTLGPDDAVSTVDTFYPATVANWHRERTGALDVTHWREMADRQTGIYEPVAELAGDQLAWLTEACCVDSQCLKRREWDEDDETPIEVPRGDGEFPCREPCSLVVAAARTFALLEREETEPGTLELTPSEREGLHELLDAVAEGRVDEVREADVDDGANRYRARYLRAKLRDRREVDGED